MTITYALELQIIKALLAKLGNSSPQHKQIKMAKRLLFRATLSRELQFNTRLSAPEVACLLLVAQGFSSAGTAQVMDLKLATINSYRKEIRRKLKCRTLAQAVFEGICFGYLQPAREHALNKGD